MLLRGNIWFIANCVIKLHQCERRLRLQGNEGELMKDIIFVGNKQRALAEDNNYMPVSEDEVSLGDEKFIVPEDPSSRSILSAGL